MKKAVNAIITRGEKFLVIKRAGGLHAGKWAFPGGIVEEGESDKKALKREIREETGLEIVKIIKKIADYSYPGKNKEKTSGSSYLVSATGKIKINHEILEARFVSIEEFEKLDNISGIEEEALSALFNN